MMFSQTTTLERRLTATANQMFRVLAPNASALHKVVVVIDEDGEDAMTAGRICIVLPATFDGIDLQDRPDVAVGLLAHELSHFLQPLDEMTEIRADTGAPHWLDNILLDVQGEALVQYLFPRMHTPLAVVRRVVHDNRLDDFLDDLKDADTFEEATVVAALAARFYKPHTVFAPRVMFHEAHKHPAYRRTANFLYDVGRAENTSAADMPALLREIIEEYPELAGITWPDIDVLLDGLSSTAADSPLRGGAGGGPLAADFEPAKPSPLRVCIVGPSRHVEHAATTLARRIAPRFQTESGGIDIVAPGRIDRREAARAGGIPFRMTVDGGATPAPQVVLCVDSSGSMWRDAPGGSTTKIAIARAAAQAIALAVAEHGGEAVGVLFDNNGYIGPNDDDGLLFAPINAWPDGGTDFGFLADVWSRFPEHLVVLLTDGNGYVPSVLPANRQRTVGIAVPPGTPDVIEPICRKVVTLSDVSKLPWVMSMLVPRTTVG